METKPGFKRMLVGSVLAAAAALFGGQPAMKSAAPPSFVAPGEADKDKRERRWRRSRRDIKRKEGVAGLGGSGKITFSLFKIARRRAAKRTWEGLELSGGSKYVFWSDGSLRHRDRGPKGQTAVRLHKAERRRLAYQAAGDRTLGRQAA